MCPMRGTHLFEECGVCHTIRHSLLRACQGYGAEKTLESIIEPTTKRRGTNQVKSVFTMKQKR